MGKKSSASLHRGKRTKRNAKTIPDREIDYSDLPRLSDKQLSVMRPLGRPLLGEKPRKLIAVRIDPSVLLKLRREANKKGTGYQSLINEILAKHVRRNGEEAA